MKLKFAVSLILSVFTVFYIIFIPGVVSENLDINIYTQRQKNAEPTYQGIVTLWNVGAPSSAVNKLVSYTEKQYVRFFIEKENVSVQEAQQRMADGEYPDIIIFSKGVFGSNPPLRPLYKEANINDNILSTAVCDGNLYALPFMANVIFPDPESTETTAPVDLWYIAVPRKNGDFKEAFLTKAIYCTLDESYQKYLSQNSLIPLCNIENLYESEDIYSIARDEIISNVKFDNVFVN